MDTSDSADSVGLFDHCAATCDYVGCYALLKQAGASFDVKRRHGLLLDMNAEYRDFVSRVATGDANLLAAVARRSAGQVMPIEPMWSGSGPALEVGDTFRRDILSSTYRVEAVSSIDGTHFVRCFDSNGNWYMAFVAYMSSKAEADEILRQNRGLSSLLGRYGWNPCDEFVGQVLKGGFEPQPSLAYFQVFHLLRLDLHYFPANEACVEWLREFSAKRGETPPMDLRSFLDELKEMDRIFACRMRGEVLLSIFKFLGAASKKGDCPRGFGMVPFIISFPKSGKPHPIVRIWRAAVLERITGTKPALTVQELRLDDLLSVILGEDSRADGGKEVSPSWRQIVELTQEACHHDAMSVIEFLGELRRLVPHIDDAGYFPDPSCHLKVAKEQEVHATPQPSASEASEKIWVDGIPPPPGPDGKPDIWGGEMIPPYSDCIGRRDLSSDCSTAERLDELFGRN